MIVHNFGLGSVIRLEMPLATRPCAARFADMSRHIRISHALPQNRVNGKRRHPAGRQIDESAMVGEPASPEELRQQSQSLISKGLVHKWRLAFQGFKRAARRQLILTVQASVNNLWKKIGNVRQPVLAFEQGAVRLAQHKLAALGIVSEVKPVKSESVGVRPRDEVPGLARIDTADNDLRLRCRAPLLV